ncbi:hypothetical protein UlMin_023287 [Ulmus minor]
MDSDSDTPSPVTAPPPKPSSTPFPGREDCWSQDATFTLIEAWGDRYLELKRGNLRQKHWQEVSDAVNSRHCNSAKTRRTDIQCKNRIDTLKKKYKVEKARVSESDGSYISPWPFFDRLDALIGATFYAGKKPSPPVADVHRNSNRLALSLSSPIPVGPRSISQKRPSPSPAPAPAFDDDAFSRRKLTAFAAAAAAAAAAEEEAEDYESGGSGSRSSSGSRRRERKTEPEFRELARAIERFGEMYERVEGAKQRQMIELEKQRMQFVKDLEFQRMQLFMETQVQLQKMKRAKRSPGADKMGKKELS